MEDNWPERVSTICKLAENHDPKSLVKALKMKRIADYLEVSNKNPKMRQSDICKQLQISQSTMHRVRKDLNLGSLYRYNVSVQTELTKHKDRYRRIVLNMFKKELISEQERDELRELINNEKFDVVQTKIKSVVGDVDAVGAMAITTIDALSKGLTSKAPSTSKDSTSVDNTSKRGRKKIIQAGHGDKNVSGVVTDLTDNLSGLRVHDHSAERTTVKGQINQNIEDILSNIE